ncbi:hypothetical protein DM02DRAFT_648895 [Periconia macrospinosa]|uniref:AMP-dependent synthetase/ligase domain-containing protein n=1 Tax=Periconia macrospinosa TaxID=97972 RepID=A0A2V1ECK2_9PLEO|nr:hypothetical protein DM02DRAFT_648895 [Periconia macrospinosa]
MLSKAQIKRHFSGLLTSHSILQDMAGLPTAVQVLRQLDYVVYGWGSLADSAGDALVEAGVGLVHAFGSAQTGTLAALRPSQVTADSRFFRLRHDVHYAVEEVVPASHEPREKYKISVRLPGLSRDLLLDGCISATDRSFHPTEQQETLTTSIGLDENLPGHSMRCALPAFALAALGVAASPAPSISARSPHGYLSTKKPLRRCAGVCTVKR